MSVATDLRPLVRAALDRASSAESEAGAAKSTATAAEQMAKLSRIDFGQFAVSYQALISVNARLDDVALAVPAAQVGDRLVIYGATEAAGYALLTHARLVTVAGAVALKVWRPALAVAANVSFVVKIIGYRDA